MARERRFRQNFPWKSKLEKTMHHLLGEMQVKFISHKRIYDIPHRYQCDIFIKPNIVLECDGEYWHQYPHGRPIDRVRNEEMKEAGYKVIRLWGKQIERMTTVQLAELINL